MSTKISQLTSATDVTANDFIQIVDVEDGVMAPSGTNKKATAQLFANELGKLTNVTATGSTTARSLANRFADVVNVKDFGAIGDGVTDDSAAIQAAIDTAHASGGGSVMLPAGTYLIGARGSAGGRNYGLVIKSNVSLFGASFGSTTIKAAPSAEIDVVRTLSTTQNISISDLTIDGNESGQVIATGFNLWLGSVTNLSITNVLSLNPSNWGIRISSCSYVAMSNVICRHSAESNSDGIHFIDTNNVTCSSIVIQTAGDDGFIIEAINQNVENYAISGLCVEPNNLIGVPARGVLLLGDPAAQTQLRTIRNISITGCVVTNASGHGVNLSGNNYENIHIESVISGGCSVAGLYLAPGSSTYTGAFLRNCRFDTVINGTTARGVFCTTANGTIEGNVINSLIRDTGDISCQLGGSSWTGSVSIQCPNTSPAIGLRLLDDNNCISVSVSGGTNSVQLDGTAQGNTLYIGRIADAATNGLVISGGSTGNTFIGGEVIGSINNSGGVTNKFIGVRGAYAYSSISLNFATNADGTASFAHGLSGTPNNVLVQQRGSTPLITCVNSVDATNITIKAIDNTGANITTGSYTYNWKASL